MSRDKTFLPPIKPSMHLPITISFLSPQINTLLLSHYILLYSLIIQMYIHKVYSVVLPFFLWKRWVGIFLQFLLLLLLLMYFICIPFFLVIYLLKKLVCFSYINFYPVFSLICSSVFCVSWALVIGYKSLTR